MAGQGKARLGAALRRLRPPAGAKPYHEAPGTASEADTRQRIEALARQVEFNRRALLGLGLVVLLRLLGMELSWQDVAQLLALK